MDAKLRLDPSRRHEGAIPLESGPGHPRTCACFGPSRTISGVSDTEIRPDEQLARAHDAFERMAWEDAFEAFSEVDLTSPLEAADLETWATACYLLGRLSDAVEALTRAFRLHRENDHAENAARIGFWIVFMLMEEGDVAQAGGWMSRSHQLMELVPPDSAARGYMLALAAYRQIAVEGDYANGQVTAEQVIQIGRDAGDPDIEALALNLKGRALVRAGQVSDGLAFLDEAMVAVTSGLLSPVVVGTVYCSLLEACEEVSELRRARQWTDALTIWCDRQSGEVPFTAQCRVHRSMVLQRRGELKEAEDEARLAYERYTRTPYESATGRASYQMAEVQRIRGELDQAEETYREASDWGADPQPGLALLRLAQGDTETATASLRRLVAETEDPVTRLRLLPAHVEVMLAANDVDAAQIAAAELADLSSRFGSDALKAQAAYAEGAVSLATGDPRGALMRLRESTDLWRSLNVPFEIARSRLLLGEACRRLGDEETASLEVSAARRQLSDLGVAEVVAPTTEEEEEPRMVTTRELEVLHLVATGMTNREIADELYLSVKTVDRHVGNILTKLGVASRTAAVAFAYENDLL